MHKNGDETFNLITQIRVICAMRKAGEKGMKVVKKISQAYFRSIKFKLLAVELKTSDDGDKYLFDTKANNQSNTCSWTKASIAHPISPGIGTIIEKRKVMYLVDKSIVESFELSTSPLQTKSGEPAKVVDT